MPPGTAILQDSGAYGEPLGSFSRRISFEDALRRQEEHAERYSYADKIAYRASYDLLVDHRMVVQDGSSRRKIVRCSGPAGIEAIDVTVQAARFLDKHRNGYNLALNAQGSTPEQYFQCVQQIVPLPQDGDKLGLGGWCIIGRNKAFADKGNAALLMLGAATLGGLGMPEDPLPFFDIPASELPF